MELVSTMEINGEEREIADAVARGQIDGVNSNLDGLGYGENGVKNLFDKSKSTIGMAIGSSGNPYTNSEFGYSDYIEISSNTSYTYSNCSWYNFYDSNKSNISQYASVTNTSPSNAKYVVLSFLLSKIDKIQIEEGTTATPYKPYIPSVKMLADEVSAQNESLAYNASKNMLSAKVGTSSGVTITSKDKSTALLNGTSTANVSVFATADVIPSGEYHLKVSNKVGSLYVWDSTHSKTIIDVVDTECNFTLTEPSKLAVGFSVGSGHSFTNFEVSGQLEKGTVATDFVPYNGKSNLELTDDVVSLKNDLGGLKFSASGTTLSITDGTNTWTLSN